MRNSRRRFLKLLAAGSAGLAARPAATLAADTRARRPARQPGGAARAPAAVPPAALRAEIERQQRDLEKTLKTLRDYPLEPGSDPAFVLTPLRAAPGVKKP
jgi:hypothetical protein